MDRIISTLYIYTCFALIFSPLCCEGTAKLRTLYNSLDPTSISQHLALYELYPQSYEGQLALQDIYQLLSDRKEQGIHPTFFSLSVKSTMEAIIGLINKQPGKYQAELDESELKTIHELGRRLPNRALKGYYAKNEEEVLALCPEEIDLARGVLLSELGNHPSAWKKIHNYEAALDLMALQILARIKINDSPEKKIEALNHFIFEELGFRFPPHSSYAKDIDLYTFLPSVLDSRRGVCLGVSILYICVAQRLNLNLEIVTPPGHIYVRCKTNEKEINIETTARGINLPSDEYLGIDTRSLQQRNIKETIGMAHFNQASIYWEKHDYDKALEAYLKAKPYLYEDRLLTSFIAFIYLLKDDTEKAIPMLKEIVDYTYDYAVSKETIAEDYFNGETSKEGIEAIFIRVNEKRESLLIKRQTLEKILEKYPRFRDGLFSLAGTWLQLHRKGEALEVLKKYHQIDPKNCSVEYYLAELYADRLDFNNAWRHLRIAETLTKERGHEPKALLSLRQTLGESCPEYTKKEF